MSRKYMHAYVPVTGDVYLLSGHVIPLQKSTCNPKTSYSIEQERRAIGRLFCMCRPRHNRTPEQGQEGDGVGGGRGVPTTPLPRHRCTF